MRAPGFTGNTQANSLEDPAGVVDLVPEDPSWCCL